MRSVTHILFFILYIHCRGQQLYFYIPDNLRQIPSSESYKIMQDSKGYIWFSTEAGLCRYNGSSLKVFDKRNGLPEAAVYGLKEDKKGIIWIATSTNRILRYINDSLKEAPFSRNLQKQFTKLDLIQLMNITDDSVFINTQTFGCMAGMYSSDIKKIVSNFDDPFQFLVYNSFLLNVGSNSKKANSKILRERQLKFSILKDTQHRSITVPYTSPSSPGFRIFSAINKKGDCFINFDNLLIKVKADGTYSYQQIPNQVIDLYLDKEDGLWAGTLKGGVYYYPDGQNLDRPVINLAGFSVAGTCEDKEKGMWCTTLEKGVFYCRNKYIKSYPGIRGFEKKAELLKAVGKSVFISSRENELIEIKNDEVIYHSLPLKEQYYSSDLALVEEDSTWLIAGSYFIKTDKNFNKLKPLNSRWHSRQISYSPGKRIFVILATSLFEVINDRTILRKERLPSQGRCLYYPGEDYLLAGLTDGLFKVDVNDFSFRQIPGVKDGITKIYPVTNNGIWIITKGNGIYIFKDERVFNLSDSLKLPTDRFLDITEDKYGTVWIGSNIGLIKLVYVSGKPVAKVYNTLNGLPSNEIFNIAAGEEELFLSTNEGICSFPLKADLSNIYKPEIMISKVLVKNRKISNPNKSFELTYDENSLKIDFDLLTFKGSQAVLYHLESKSAEPVFGSATGNELTLNNLKPGIYKLKAYAVNNNKLLSGQPAVLNFEVNKPFWQTVIFIFLCNLTVCLVIVFIARFIINRIRRKETEKTRINKLIAEYQLSALRAQMNPHFIFNCINSIQRYILTNKPEEAYNYLSKFSKLIRLVLDYAEENLITLAQELEIVTLYLELEQQRFEHKFSYNISVHESIDVNDTKVPAMMLQPYVENAIWHGLMNVNDGRERYVSLQFNRKDGILEIIIEDNGVGRERAAALSSKKYRPKANGINNKRTEMLNILIANKGSIRIEDIKYNAIISGTRVIIHIPQRTDDE